MRSPAEVRFRLKQELANIVLAAFPPSPRLTDVATPLPGLPDPMAVAAAVSGTPWAARLIATAEQIMSGHIPLLGTVVETGSEPAWRRDYVSGKESSLAFFRRIPYLDAKEVGDHKNIWELSRHQHLVLVAQAFSITRDARYSRFVIVQLRHWWRENPFQRGINWASSLEVGFRALSWLWIFHLLGPALDAGFREEFLTQLYRHGLHLEYNLSLYFSPNTHLLGEALALHAIGFLIPSLPRSATWKANARKVLLAELQKQVHPDGGYFEQSTYYHVYALDIFLFHHALDPLPDTERLRAMAEFLAALVNTDGTFPFLGDDDGGRLFFPFGPRNRFARATLATSSVALNRRYFDYVEADLLDQAVWWLGPQALQANPAPQPPQVSRLFPQSGLISIRSGDIRMLFDAGPFGPWGGGHSHSDTLSLVVSAGGHEILIDPGTYTYVGDPTWREYFRGSSAHNTVRVNGRDQADAAGPFRWLNKPEPEVLTWETNADRDIAEAVCASAGIRHRRCIEYRRKECTLVITDVIEGDDAECLIEQFWHPGETTTSLGGGRWRIGEHAVLALQPGVESELMEGWRSDSHASKRPAPVIRLSLRSRLPVTLNTTLQFDENQS